MAKNCLLAALLIVAPATSFAEEIPPIFLSHTDTIWGNRGYCAYSIGLDAGGGSASPEMLDLKITVKVLSEGETIGEFSPRTETLTVPRIGGANANRYNSVGFESACELDTIQIVSATAILAESNKKIDLLASGLLVKKEHHSLPFKFSK